MSKLRTNIMQPGESDLYSKLSPNLEGGSYNINVSQEVEWTGNESSHAPAFQEFYVKAPRYFLDPMDVGEPNPRPNSQGMYENVLPHITLTKPTLLWTRLNKEDNGEKLPWLSLLLLRDDEWINDGKPITGTIKEFKTSKDGVFIPKLEEEIEDDNEQICQYIEIPVAMFYEKVPKVDEIKWLVHARTSPNNRKQGISVAVAKRFPVNTQKSSKGQQFATYLISMEGLKNCYDRNEFCSVEFIRLLCLVHWKFTSYPDTRESFGELIKRIIKSANEDPENAWLRLPVSQLHLPESSAQRLFDGYVPLEYRVRTGEKTLTWYQSPLIPVDTGRERPMEKSYYTSEEGIIYEPQNGLFDTSWATAWQLGRMLALADSRFLEQMFIVRRDFLRELPKKISNEDGEIWETFEDGLSISTWAETISKVFSDNMHTKESSIQRPAWRKKCRAERRNPISILRDRMNEKGVSFSEFTAAKTDAAGDVKNWLQRLINMEDIPLSFFVAHERMLPMEQVRFFKVDPQWIEFLLDGAISVGIHNFADKFISASWLRKEIMNKYKNGNAYGLIIRSALISGWPGVQINAWNNGKELEQLLKIRPQEQVLSCIFNDVPDKITITEPHEELSFGMNTGTGDIQLRYIDLDNIGKQIDSVKFPFKNYVDADGILDVNKVNDDIKKNVSQYPNNTNTEWGPAHLAIHMLNGADQGCFAQSDDICKQPINYKVE